MMRRSAMVAASLVAIVLFVVASHAPLALAQSLGDLSSLTSASVPPLTLSLSSQYPQPYSSVTLSVESTTLDLANATLNVLVNGTSAYKGSVQPVAVTIGAPGRTTTIEADVLSQGQTYTQSLSVDPGDVSLVEEPVASVPPLYPGKPLVPLSGEVRLVAVAGFRSTSGAAIDPATLSYTWMQDSNTLASGSGIGKSAIIVGAPLQYRSGDYSVVVETQDGAQIGSGSVSLAPADPSLRVYAIDPLLGIEFDHALGSSYSIRGPEASFYAAPFSFSLAGGAPALEWFLNGSSAQTGSSITLRPTGSGAGSGSLSLSASESGNYESASTDLSLSYGAGSGGGIFGL